MKIFLNNVKRLSSADRASCYSFETEKKSVSRSDARRALWEEILISLLTNSPRWYHLINAVCKDVPIRGRPVSTPSCKYLRRYQTSLRWLPWIREHIFINAILRTLKQERVTVTHTNAVLHSSLNVPISPVGPIKTSSSRDVESTWTVTACPRFIQLRTQAHGHQCKMCFARKPHEVPNNRAWKQEKKQRIPVFHEAILGHTSSLYRQLGRPLITSPASCLCGSSHHRDRGQVVFVPGTSVK